MSTTTRIKWMLFIVPAFVIGMFETIRHTLLEHILPMEIGNWITAVIDAAVIALVSRTLFHQFVRLQKELGEEKQAHAVLKERERLAKVLHDQIAQSIFYSGVQTQAARKFACRCGEAELITRLDEVTSSLREIDENIRQSIFNLRSGTTDKANLRERVESYLKKTLSATGIIWDIRFPESCPPLTPSEDVQLFGILQEAITNIVKHAKASRVSVVFQTSPNAKMDWVFEIRDDGIGYTSQHSHSKGLGHGVNLMSNRARDIGAKLKIESGSLEAGTLVIVERSIKQDQN